MPLVYQQNINEDTRLGLWHISEPESFFLQTVPLQNNITHPHKRLQHLAGRLLLTELFGDFPIELIQIADTRKPFLPNESFHFSVSHCGSYAAAIVSRTARVGVDIEVVAGKVERIQHKFLVAEEIELLNELCNESTGLSKLDLLTMGWSVKEALFKWYSLGQVDFRGNMKIDRIKAHDNHFVFHSVFNKGIPQRLSVHAMLFNGNCISWVVS